MLPLIIRHQENFEGGELDRRREQVLCGLRKCREEILVITKRYLLTQPILLLLLTDQLRGPAFLRATLSILHEYGDKAQGVELVKDTGDQYGMYIYANPADCPEDEQKWYDLLTHKESNIDDLIHFWQQFCLNWPCLAGDLQKLSKQNPSPEDRLAD